MSPERPPSVASYESRTTKKEDLPPPIPKEQRGLRSDIKKPLAQVQLTTFVHVLICILLVCLAWYTYRTTLVAVDSFKSGAVAFPSLPYADLIWKFISRPFGWGVQAYSRYSKGPHAAGVERRVEELADALGVHPLDLAGAIADAVRQLVSPETLHTLANEAKKAGGAHIIDALLGEYAHGVHIADGARGTMG